MESKETVVFEIDVSSYNRSLAELSNSINALKADQKALAEQTKQGMAGAAEQLERTNAQLKIQQQQYRSTQSVLVGYLGAKQKEVDVNKFANNSIQTNRDLLKQLTAQYINTQKPSEELTKKVKQLSDTLKQQEGAIGDTRRNVGNYAESLTTALSGLKGFGGQLVSVGQNIGSSINAFKAAETGIQGFSAALMTTGLPILISGLNAVIDILSEFPQVADTIEDSTKGISAGLSALVRGNGSFFEVAQEVMNLNSELRDLEDVQSLYNLQLEKTNTVIDEYLLKSRNKSNSLEEQLRLTKEAGKIEKKSFDEQIKNREDFVSKQEDLFRAEYGLTKTLLEELITNAKGNSKEITDLNKIDGKRVDELRNRRQEVDKFRHDGILLSERIAKREAEIQDKIDARDQKATDDAKAQVEKRAKDKIEIEKQKQDALSKLADENSRLEQLRIEATEIGLERERDLYLLSFEQKFTDLKKAGLTEQQIEEYKQRGLAEIEAKYANQKKEFVRLTEEEITAIKKEQQDKQQKEADKALQQYKDSQQKIVDGIAQIVQSASNFIGAIGDLLQQNAANNVAILDEQYKQGRISKRKFDAEAKAEKEKGWRESKAVAITQAVMNTATAVMAQLSNPTPYVGIILAAFAAATGAAQIALIARQKQPAFAKGVIGLNGAGTETSDSIDARLSKGESVITAKATRKYHRELAEMEMSVGNVPNYNFGSRHFAGGVIGFSNAPSDGGFVSREVKSNVESSQFLRAAIIEGFTNAPAPELSLVEFSKKQKLRSRSVNVSEF